jgi:hypothetical protein
MFALTMLIQFSSYVLSSMDRIGRTDGPMPDGKMENA